MPCIHSVSDMASGSKSGWVTEWVAKIGEFVKKEGLWLTDLDAV